MTTDVSTRKNLLKKQLRYFIRLEKPTSVSFRGITYPENAFLSRRSELKKLAHEEN